MIFNKFKKVTLGYFVKHKHAIPKFLFQDISTNIGCPATKSLNNRIYDVKPIVSATIEFGVDSLGVAHYKYLFDTKTFQDKQEVYDIFDDMVFVSIEKDKATLQLASYVHLVTDCKDLEVTQLEPVNKNYENCDFVVGSYYPYEWIRMLNASYRQIDKNKKAVVTLNIENPFFRILTSRKVNLKLINYTEKIKDYEQYIHRITRYYSNLKNVYDRITKKRPKYLLK